MCMHVCMYACMCVYLCIYVSIYLHTHNHTHTGHLLTEAADAAEPTREKPPSATPTPADVVEGVREMLLDGAFAPAPAGSHAR